MGFLGFLRPLCSVTVEGKKKSQHQRPSSGSIFSYYMSITEVVV